MFVPDLHQELEQLLRASRDTHAEVDRLVRLLTTTRPRTVQSLHDTKAHLAYLRLMLRTVQQELATLDPPPEARQEDRCPHTGG